MSYKDYTVRVEFDDGINQYTFKNVFHISDPKEGMKSIVIHGNRGDGAIVIPGGKKSQEITIRGRLFESDGYKELTDAINTMKTNITTNEATLTLKHYDGSWITDWSYTVRRISEIRFPQSYRTESQEYEVNFLVLTY